jgi:membrane dipeptidase
MRYSDLHCDTVSRCYKEKKSFLDGDLQINLSKIRDIEKYEQYFALWLSDELRGEAAFSLCKNMLDCYEGKIKPVISDCSNISAHLSIENAAALGGNIDNIGYFKSRGVEMMSLTWNGENELASGAYGYGGLKSFGREVVREMARLDMTLDVSHLNERGFYEVCLIDSVKIIASHSNCYDICPHKRNLKRWQVIELVSRGGLVGLNFYPRFAGEGCIFEKIRENIEYLMSMGGENAIAFGGDFDGAKMSEKLDGIDKVADLYGYLSGCGFDEGVLYKIFYGNAKRVMTGG